MKYRIQLDFAFDNEDDALKLWEAIKAIKKKAVNISSEEKIRANIHKCYHDEGNVKPCQIIEEIKAE